MGRKGRQTRLSWEIVREIRDTYRDGITTRAEICAEHKISKGHLSSILTGRLWKDDDYRPPKRFSWQERSQAWIVRDLAEHGPRPVSDMGCDRGLRRAVRNGFAVAHDDGWVRLP